MNQFKLMHLTRRRTETTFVGGDDAAFGRFLPKQTVHIIGPADADEDIWNVTTTDGQRHRVYYDDLRPSPDSPLNNDEFVTLMMNNSTTGALMHPFILIAIEEYAKQVVAADPASLDTGLVNGAAWQATAKEALEWFATRREADRKRYPESTPAG